MEKENESIPICKSVFKNGENSTTEQAFTDKWVQLINTLEKSKNLNKDIVI